MLHAKPDLTVGSISDHFRRMAIPSAIGMVLTNLYGLADTFFAGLLSTAALAALTISLPVFYLLSWTGLGVNSALVALVGNALGSNNPERAKRLACQGLSYAVLFSVFLVLVGFALAPLMIHAVTEPGTVRMLARAYLNVLLFSIPAFIVFFAASALEAAQGSAVITMRSQVAAFLANIVLSPLLMFGLPGWFAGIGFNGIAVSTLVSQTGSMAYVLRWALRSELMKSGPPSTYRPVLPDFRAITGQSLPTSVGTALVVFSSFIVQVYLKAFGPEAIAAYGVALRLQHILLLPGAALAFTLRAIVAQNYGAVNYDRVRGALVFCCKSGVALRLGGAFLLWVGGRWAMSLFTTDPEVVRIGGEFMIVLGVLLPFFLLILVLSNFLQALQHSSWVFWINFYERFLAVLFFIGVFLFAWERSTTSVWFGIATSTLTGFLLALFITVIIARKEIGGLHRH